jgi:hypothetical protein
MVRANAIPWFTDLIQTGVIHDGAIASGVHLRDSLRLVISLFARCAASIFLRPLLLSVSCESSETACHQAELGGFGAKE